jgi:hypothetical protein
MARLIADVGNSYVQLTARQVEEEFDPRRIFPSPSAPF